MGLQARRQPLGEIQRLFDGGVLSALSDAELVDRFAAERDPDAFAVIVARHGPMVHATCRGILGTRSGDDAFQATFLILLNRAGTFPVGDSLGGWLRRVAGRVARQARLAENRRRRREILAVDRPVPDPAVSAERAEIIRRIRREVDRLPEKYRAPVVLCDLEGLNRDEAASLLGCPPGTVGGRLARARRQLRDRLNRQGISPSITLPLFADLSAPADSWRHVVEGSICAASKLGAGGAAGPLVLTLSVRGGRAAIGIPIKLTAAAIISIVTIGLGVSVARGRDRLDPPSQSGPARAVHIHP